MLSCSLFTFLPPGLGWFHPVEQDCLWWDSVPPLSPWSPEEGVIDGVLTSCGSQSRANTILWADRVRLEPRSLSCEIC